MLDNALSELIVNSLKVLANVVQNPQPTTQGHATAPTIYFQHLFDNRVGRPKVRLEWNESTHQFDEIEDAYVESNYQISAVAPTTSAVSASTSFDLASNAVAVLQSQKFIRQLAGIGMGIQRVSQVRNPYFVDDNKRNVPMPSFDIVFSHNRILVNGVPEIKSVDVDLKRV